MVTSIRIMATFNQEAVFRAWLERKNKEYRVRKKTKFKLLHMYICIYIFFFYIGGTGGGKKRNGERKESL